MTEKDTDDFGFDSWEFFRSATVGNVRDCLWAGFDPNARDKNGFTPLCTGRLPGKATNRGCWNFCSGPVQVSQQATASEISVSP